MFIIDPFRFGSGDPYWSSVVSLLHFDGIDGSATFTDQTGKTWLPAPNATISNLQSVFGGTSGKMLSGGNIATADNADWEFGSGDFTLEGRVYFRSSVATAASIVTKTDPNYGPFIVYQDGAGNLGFYASSNGTSWDVVNNLSFGSVSADTWYAWAVTRSGTTFRTFLDGTLISSTTSSASLIDNSQGVFIGKPIGAIYFDGYIDEFRATKGVARYTASYTVAASPFPDS